MGEQTFVRLGKGKTLFIMLVVLFVVPVTVAAAVDCTEYTRGYAKGFTQGHLDGSAAGWGCSDPGRFTMLYIAPCTSTKYAGYEEGSANGYREEYQSAYA